MGNQQLNKEDKMNIEVFEEKLRNKFPDEHYTILYHGKHSSENSVLLCLDCNRRIEVNTGELFRARRKHICAKCHYKRQDTLTNENTIRERLTEHGHNDISFFMKDRQGIRHNMVHFRCGLCGRTNEKEVANFLRQKFDCGFCEGVKESKDTDIFIKELEERHGNSLSLVSEYHNAATNVTIRCNQCGFIRQIKPGAVLISGYCPKCGKKDSKGEAKINNFLEKKGIEFEAQKYFSDWDIGIHYFDFYIPQYNLVLEYHGRQHYEFVPHFHKTKENFQYRLRKDKTKKEQALAHGLNYVSISYQTNDLETILSNIFNSTTIPRGSRGKCLEIETAQDLGEDIVYSPLKDGVEK